MLISDLFALARDGVAIKYVATDGDALASRGIQDAMPAGMETQRQSDTTHLSQTQFRHIMKASFSSMMFPGENAARRTEKQKTVCRGCEDKVSYGLHQCPYASRQR